MPGIDDDLLIHLKLPATWPDWFQRVEKLAEKTGLPFSAFYPPHPSIIKKLGPIPAPPARWSK